MQDWDSAHSGIVAKHYINNREGFESTARHWAQAYAQAPASVTKSNDGRLPTDAELAGIAEEHVQMFENMGFPRAQVVSHRGIGIVSPGRLRDGQYS